jgi:hypothetical protein
MNKKWLPHIEDNCFFEIYGSWPEHGEGSMLVFYAPSQCEYVRFEALDGSFKKIINEDLLKRYYKELKDDNA